MNHNNNNNNNNNHSSNNNNIDYCASEKGCHVSTDENENIKNIERILRKFENNDSIVLYSLESSPGSQLGDNYMSVVKRIKVTGHVNGNEAYFRQFIIKRQIASISRRQLFRCNEAFTNEIAAYCHLISIFRTFSKGNLPYPHCMFAGYDDQGDAVMLEDLRQSGYRMVNRLEGLDYAHCKVVMQELGSLHAISIAMKHKNPKQFYSAKEKVKEIVYCTEAEEFYTHSLESSLHEALTSLRMNNTNGHLDSAISKLERLSGKLYKLMSNHILNNDDEQWNVMCHGDLWINNLMFKYDDCDIVAGVKLLDLQTVRYTSPVIDILHFIYSSTRSDLRRNYLEILLCDYMNALMGSLWTHLHDTKPESLSMIKNTFTIDYIKEQLKSKALYGLGVAMWLLPAVTFYPDKIPDLDTVTLSDFKSSNQQKTITQMQTPEYHARMLEVALEFDRKDFLKDLQ